ncbi:SURF1 family protein [Roseovarius sp. SYSU LYC5161]|uniref:SURF1 family protein n=1 Tax=Roseovarius halophilus (ex Wu et al. 2025) TaxID=3376060 RepID=UPI00399B821E
MIVPILFGLAGVAVLVSLGVWQVQRLAWKEGVLAEIEATIAAAPGPLPAQPAAAEDKYRPVEITGNFRQGALRVLVSRKRVGAGHLIISPFETADGRRILVDRGFLELETELSAPPQGRVTVTGNLHWPDDRNDSTPENDVAGNTWFARDIGQMADVLDTGPVLVVARRLSQSDTDVTPLPVDTDHIPNDHLEYAITWFSLAAIWLVMTVYFLWRTRRTQGGWTP